MFGVPIWDGKGTVSMTRLGDVGKYNIRIYMKKYHVSLKLFIIGEIRIES